MCREGEKESAVLAMTREQIQQLMDETPERQRRLATRLLADPTIQAEIRKPVQKPVKTFTRRKVKVAKSA